MQMDIFVKDEVRQSQSLGFDINGEFQESIFVRNFLKDNDLIQIDKIFYFFCKEDYIWKEAKDEKVKEMAYYAFPSEGNYIWKSKYASSYFPLIKTLTKSRDKVNLYPYKVNFYDFVYNFRDCKYEEKIKKNYFTYERDFSVKKKPLSTPVFSKFITDITLGNKDLEEYLLVVLAYLISGDNKLQKFFILKGSGANGKSTFINLLTKLVGDKFVTSISLGKINDRFSLSKALGKKIIVASENESVKAVSTETIKKLTGDDLVEIEQKYKDGFSSKLNIETVFSVNNTVHFSENSYGLKRRLEVIPFDFRIKPEAIDYDLEKKLENEIPDIMVKLIDIHRDFVKNGYQLPKNRDVEVAKQKFLDEGMRSSLGSGVFDFLEENIQVESGSRDTKKSIYQAYLNNNGSCTSTKFWMDFNKWKEYKEYYGIGEVHNKERIKTGIRLKSKTKDLLK